MRLLYRITWWKLMPSYSSPNYFVRLKLLHNLLQETTIRLYSVIVTSRDFYCEIITWFTLCGSYIVGWKILYNWMRDIISADERRLNNQMDETSFYWLRDIISVDKRDIHDILGWELLLRWMRDIMSLDERRHIIGWETSYHWMRDVHCL